MISSTTAVLDSAATSPLSVPPSIPSSDPGLTSLKKLVPETSMRCAASHPATESASPLKRLWYLGMAAVNWFTDVPRRAAKPPMTPMSTITIRITPTIVGTRCRRSHTTTGEQSTARNTAIKNCTRIACAARSPAMITTTAAAITSALNALS
jgi:hypothetical protein